MLFTIERPALKSALKRAAVFARQNSSIPALSCVLIDAAGDRIILTASDNDCAIRVAVDAQVKEDGRALFDAAQLGRIVDAATADVRIETAKGTARITSGAAAHTVRLRETDEFPKIEPPEVEHVACMDAADLARICRVAYAISKDDSRPIFMGASFEASQGRAVMIATDGHRMATAECAVTGAEIKPFIIPARAVLAMASLDGKVGLSVVGPKLHVETQGVELIICGISGAFPDIKGVLGFSIETTVKVSAARFAEAVKTAAIASPKTGTMRLLMDGDKVICSAETSEAEARAEAEAVIDGPSVVLGMNWHYLLDAITAAAWPSLTLEIADQDTPVIIKGEGATHVVMPMQI